MKKFTIGIMIAFVVALLAGVLFAEPTFVTGRMMDRRNGLTDAQYEALWKIGRNPAITPQAARDWMFRASRYQNVTNWLDVCGQTNDFAKLSYRLGDEVIVLGDSNVVLRADLKTTKDELDHETARADAAEEDAHVTRELRKAAKRTEKNIEKVIKALNQAKKKSADETEEALWNALIAILEGKDPN